MEALPAALLAKETRQWQAAAPANEGRFPKQGRENAEDRLAKRWSDMLRLHLQDLSASDRQVLRDVPGVDWDKLTLSPAARLAKAAGNTGTVNKEQFRAGLMALAKSVGQDITSMQVCVCLASALAL